MIVVDPRLERRLALRRLFVDLGVEVVATRWSRACHPERSEGSSAYAAVEIMRAGCFEKRGSRGRVLADPATLVFFDPGESFEIRHPVGALNAGLTLRVAPTLLAGRPGARDRASFRHASAPCPAPVLLAAQQLVARLTATGRADPLADGEAVLALLDQVLDLDARDTGPRDAREAAPTAAAQQCAHDVLALLNARFAEPLRLQDVAAAAGCSVWHVSRQFRRATGGSIHACLTRLRLRHALEALASGAEDLSQLAHALGFSSHSHFTAAFRREFGLAPARARAALRAAREVPRAVRSTPRRASEALRLRRPQRASSSRAATTSGRSPAAPH